MSGSIPIAALAARSTKCHKRNFEVSQIQVAVAVPDFEHLGYTQPMSESIQRRLAAAVSTDMVGYSITSDRFRGTHDGLSGIAGTTYQQRPDR
jgi:hypothetical protein